MSQLIVGSQQFTVAAPFPPQLLTINCKLNRSREA